MGLVSPLAWKKKIHRGPFFVWNINNQKKKKFKFVYHQIFLRRVSHPRPRRLVCVALLSFVLISLKSSLIRSIPRLVALPSPPLQTLAHLPRPGGARSRGPLIQINRRRARSLTPSCPCDALCEFSCRDGYKIKKNIIQGRQSECLKLSPNERPEVYLE